MSEVRPQVPKLNAAGTLAAFLVENNLQIWTVESGGKLVKNLWDFDKAYPNGMVYDFDWLGDSLLLSKSDSNRLTVPWSSTPSAERISKTRFPGDTVLLDPATGQVRPLLKTAYRTLAASGTGKYFAASGRSQADKPALTIEFFEVAANAAKPLGTFSQPGWDVLSRRTPMPPMFLGWDGTGSGLYVVGPASEKQQGDAFARYRQPVFYVDRASTGKEILPPRASVSMSKNVPIGLGEAKSGGGTWAFYTYLEQVRGVGKLTPKGLVAEIEWQTLVAPLEKKLKRPFLLGFTPNARYVLFQDYGPDDEFKASETGDLWLVDLKQKRRRKVGVAGPITFAGNWGGDKLVIEVGCMDGKLETLRAGVVQVPEATLPADAEPTGLWESPGPEAGPDPSVTAVAQFLANPALKLPAGIRPALDKLAEGFLKNQYPAGTFFFRLVQADEKWLNEPYVAYDAKAGRVIGFSMPASLGAVPDDALPPERLQGAAKELVVTLLGKPQGARTWSALPLVESGPRTGRRFLVHEVEGTNSYPARAVVELFPGDARALTYREISSTPANSPIITEARAREVVVENLKATGATREAVVWHVTRPGLLVLENQPRHVWTVAAGLAATGDATRKIVAVSRWEIDAVTGAILEGKPLGELERLQYTAVAPPVTTAVPPLIHDFAPRWSPDGKFVAFLSDRVRPGAPAWQEKRPPGLYLVEVSSRKVSALATFAQTPPLWSLDGRYLAYESRVGEGGRGKFMVYDRVAATEIAVPEPDAGAEQMVFGWGPDNRLYLGAIDRETSRVDLMAWNPVSKTAEVAVRDWAIAKANPRGYVAWSLSPDGKRLALVWQQTLSQSPTRGKNTVVFELPADQLSAAAKTLAANQAPIEQLQWTPQGLLAIGASSHWYLSDKPRLVPPLGTAPQMGPSRAIVTSERTDKSGATVLFLRTGVEAKPVPLTQGEN